MPKKAFLNLQEDKKEKLEKAALQEFSSYTYDEISINRVILSIGMPRGSFYLYFNDKEDLYLYIFQKYHKMLLDFISKTIIETNGDLIDVFKELFINITSYIQDGEYGILLKKFFIGLNHNIENKMFNFEINERICQIRTLFIQKFSYHHTDIDDLLDLLSNLLVHSLTSYYIFNLDYDKVKERLFHQLDIIRKGIE